MSVELNSYPTLLNDASLIAYYRLEGNANDTKGSFDGTFTSPSYSSGMFGQDANFTTSNYINLGDVLSFERNEAWTNSFWHKSTDGGNDLHLLSKQASGGVNQGIFTEFHGGKYRQYLFNGSGLHIEVITNSTYNDGAWKLVTITYDGSVTAEGIKIYINGTLVASTINVNTQGAFTTITTEGFQINGRWNSTNSTHTGEMDDIAIFSRVLTPTEISDYYNTSAPSIGTVKALVVGGGGGGGGGRGGGGGAGRMIYDSALPISAQAYTVTVGTGGAGGVWNTGNGVNGTSSVLSTLTAIGGGGGASESYGAGLAGGSGGGGVATGFAGGTATGGNNGGTGGDATNYCAAGGGGAGAVGVDGTSTACGNGGAGSANSISGSSATYAGGGGGGGNGGTPGTGGAGGGGNGQVTSGTAGGNGTANTGGGGGGGAGTASRGVGGDGGSGIVIISYATDGSDGISTSSTGGTVTTSGTQTIHTFTSSGTFTAVASEAVNNGAGMFAFFFA